MSLTATPCSLYTCCTDSRINCCASTSPFIFKISCGETGPSVIFVPFSINISLVTTKCSPTGTVYSWINSPVSGSSIKIKEAGDSLFLEDELIDKKVVERENEILISKGKRPATYEPVIQGITKAAVNTESFISASSFQETTKVLANAAVEGKTDRLEGLKENVIIGKKIPGGTGFKDYKYLDAVLKNDIMEEENAGEQVQEDAENQEIKVLGTLNDEINNAAETAEETEI